MNVDFVSLRELVVGDGDVVADEACGADDCEAGERKG